ncbi:MAG: lepB [Cyanobacteria bacterium RYN_339]|nr:lepB [Cyanobacteria bacterium RYN_339]
MILARRFLPVARKPKSPFREAAEILGIALFLSLFIRTSVAEARYIPSESMLPTLEVGDRLVIEKVAYRLHAPTRGDIVVIKSPSGDAIPLIKRVIGLPGERISIHAGKVWIDGKPLVEPYVLEAPLYDEPNWLALGLPGGLIPDGKVFLMGDNRNNSRDSHMLGAMPLDDIIGHTVFRFWPPSRVGAVGSRD